MTEVSVTVAERGLGLAGDVEGGAIRPPELIGGTALQGHLRSLAADNLALFKRCAALGGLVRFRVYWYTCHVLTDPELAGALLVSQAAAFKKTRALQIARPTFGDGLVTSEGEARRRQQKLLSAFFTPKATAGYTRLIEQAAAEQLEGWPATGGVDLHEEAVSVSLELVCRTLFGLDATRLKPLIRDAAHAVQRWHSECQALCLPYPHYLPIAANFRYRARTRILDRAVFALLGELRGSSGDDHGALGSLLQLRSRGDADISDREIRDHIVTLFLAGHDTTAASLALSLYELSYRPDLQERIVGEARAGRADCLEHVIKECLRLYPAVHLVARTAIQDVQLGPYLVRRNEEVVLPLYVMQRSPKLFARPDEFWPERWADPRGAVCPRYAHLPFSAGPRVCIGQSLAMAELRSIIAATLRRFRLEPLGPREPRIEARMTLGPAPASTRVRAVAR